MNYLPHRRTWTRTRVQRWALASVGVVLVLTVLSAVVAAVTGLLLLLALAIGLSLVNLIYVPRLASRLRIAPAWLAVTLLPLLVLVGLVIGGAGGGAWAAALWIVGIGLPRVLGRDLARRVRSRLDGSGGARVYDVMGRTGGPGGRPLPHVTDPGRDEFGL